MYNMFTPTALKDEAACGFPTQSDKGCRTLGCSPVDYTLCKTQTTELSLLPVL